MSANEGKADRPHRRAMAPLAALTRRVFYRTFLTPSSTMPPAEPAPEDRWQKRRRFIEPVVLARKNAPAAALFPPAQAARRCFRPRLVRREGIGVMLPSVRFGSARIVVVLAAAPLFAQQNRELPPVDGPGQLADRPELEHREALKLFAWGAIADRSNRLITRHSPDATSTDAEKQRVYGLPFAEVLNQSSAAASLGMRQSPRGERLIEPTLGPSGRQERLNWFAKNRRKKTVSQRRNSAGV